MPSETAKEKAEPGKKYRLRAQVKDREEEGLGPPSRVKPRPDSSATSSTRRWFTPPGAGRLGLSRFSVAEWAVAAVTVVLFLLMAALTGRGTPLLTAGQVGLVALIPLGAVTFILGWADRWAPLKPRAKIVAALWGAGVAAGVAGVVNSAALEDLLLSSGNFNHALFAAAVAVAPATEETFKGVGVLLVLWLVRTHLFSSLSAMALGGLVGAGFAYIENLEYFLLALSEGSVSFGLTVFARGVLSPFVHPMATSLIGLAVGAAILRRASAWGWTWRLTLGWVAAVSIHALWNGLAAQGAQWVLWYLFLEVPLFAVWLAALLIWSGRQPFVIRQGLLPYVSTGWLSPSEVQMVTDPGRRRAARAWAKRLGRPAPRMLRRFERLCGYLGLDQVLMTERGMDPQRLRHDREYLQDILGLQDQMRTLAAQRRDLEVAGRGRR